MYTENARALTADIATTFRSPCEPNSMSKIPVTSKLKLFRNLAARKNILF